MGAAAIDLAAEAIRERWPEAALECAGDDVQVCEALAKAALDAVSHTAAVKALDATYAGKIHHETLTEALDGISNDIDGYVLVADLITAIHAARGGGS